MGAAFVVIFLVAMFIVTRHGEKSTNKRHWPNRKDNDGKTQIVQTGKIR